MKTEAIPRRIPVYVVVPPRTLLLDVAGPIEVLRWANHVQEAVRFEVSYIGPATNVVSSIGLQLTKIEPMPDVLPDNAMIVLAGNVSQTLGAAVSEQKNDGAAEANIVRWLRSVFRPAHTVVAICSGALMAGSAGLLWSRLHNTLFGFRKTGSIGTKSESVLKPTLCGGWTARLERWCDRRDRPDASADS